MNNKQLVEKRIREFVPELQEAEIVSSNIKGIRDGRAVFPTIHLEHVLRAIEDVHSRAIVTTNTETLEGVVIDDVPQGDIVLSKEYEIQDYTIKFLHLYDLTKPFNDQSEELYNFLAEILLDNK